ncbi:hypothetical protein IFR05_017116, partial [Cadophora sp. M221]
MHLPDNQLFFNTEKSSVNNSWEIDQYLPASGANSDVGFGDPALCFALPHVASDAHSQNFVTSMPHATPSAKVRNTPHDQQQPFGMFQTQLPTQDRQYDITQTMSPTRADVGDLQDIAGSQTASQYSSGGGRHRCHWAQCKETFQTGALLQTHVKSHTKPLKSVYICLWRGCLKNHRAAFHLNTCKPTRGLMPAHIQAALIIQQRFETINGTTRRMEWRPATSSTTALSSIANTV